MIISIIPDLWVFVDCSVSITYQGLQPGWLTMPPDTCLLQIWVFSDCTFLDNSIEKHDNTLYDIILYIKNTCPDALVHIVQILDFNKINKNKESMLKDTRFDKKSKKLFRNTIDLLLSCADGKCINELQAIKELK